MIRQLLGRTKTLTKSASRVEYDALDLLRADHMKVEALLVQLRLIKSPPRRKALFRQIREALEQHMHLEETIFYPACASLPGLAEKMDHAHSDHQLVKAVIEDL